MSCSPFDLKDYFFGELAEPARGQIEAHLAACPACREELTGLDVTRAALLSVPDEEPPRRIAFVSDKVFEPRWWQRLWASGSQLGFAAAAMLAVAIVAHGYIMRPPAAVVQAPASAAVIESEVAKRLQNGSRQSRGASEERQTARTVDMLNTKLREVKLENRENLLMIRDYFEWQQKRDSTRVSRTAYDQ